jgi:hypothetical protein
LTVVSTASVDGVVGNQLELALRLFGVAGLTEKKQKKIYFG